ncbi:hypothetical protein LJC63_11145, partial [Ruminococcaceae bacterium OttesenSCG-928-L11]|nr:hypothetical protein [Ruminococcaceae bacterium OttesenSCG-928-L11]
MTFAMGIPPFCREKQRILNGVSPQTPFKGLNPLKIPQLIYHVGFFRIPQMVFIGLEFEVSY